jgi:hypothetical protein
MRLEGGELRSFLRMLVDATREILHKNCGALTKDTVAVGDSELAAMVVAAAAAVCEIPCVMRRLPFWHIVIPCNVDV